MYNVLVTKIKRGNGGNSRFLDNLTEELEEEEKSGVYDDYKFVTETELKTLGLERLVVSDECDLLGIVDPSFPEQGRCWKNTGMRGGRRAR